MVTSASVQSSASDPKTRRATLVGTIALVVAVAGTAAKAVDLLLHAVAVDRSAPLALLWPAVAGWLLVIATRRALPNARTGQVRATAIVLAAVLLIATAAHVAVYGIGAQSEPYVLVAAAAACVAIAVRPGRTLQLVSEIRLPSNADLRHRSWPSPRVVLLAALAAGIVVWAMVNDANLFIGHDESVYANKARSWLTDLPDVGFIPTRPLVLPGLGYVALAIHQSLFSLRIVGLLLAVGTLVALYLVGAKLSSKARAVVAVLVVLTMATFVVRMTEFLTDISSSGLLLVLAYLVIRAQQKDKPNALLAAAVVALAAFYLRYGVISGIGAIALAGLLGYGWRAWWRQRWHVLGVAAIFLVGLLPHFWYAQDRLGSPIAVMTTAGKGAGRAFPGEGLVDYLVWLPRWLAGDLGGVLIVAGAVLAGMAMWQLWRGRVEPPERWTIVLTLASAFQVLLLGATAHGEPRFIFFTLMAMTLVGVHLVATRAPRFSRLVLLLIVAVCALQLPGNAFTLSTTLAGGESRRAPLVDAAKAAGVSPPCTIVGPAYTFNIPPEVGWYAGCEVLGFSQIVKLDRANPMVIFRYPAQPNLAADQVIANLIADRPTDRQLYGTPGDADSVEVIRFR